MEKTVCACCGASYPVRQPEPVCLDDIPENEHAKHALVIAILGGFSVHIEAVDNRSVETANMCGLVAQSYGLLSVVTRACACGMPKGAQPGCFCSPDIQAAWDQTAGRRHAAGMDMTIGVWESPVPHMLTRSERTTQFEALLAARRGEWRPAARVRDLNSEAFSMLKSAQAQADMNTHQLERLLRVAAVCAQVAQSGQIRPVHIAEALQYRPRPVAFVEPLGELNP